MHRVTPPCLIRVIGRISVRNTLWLLHKLAETSSFSVNLYFPIYRVTSTISLFLYNNSDFVNVFFLILFFVVTFQVTNDIQSVLKLCSAQNAENRQVEGSMSQMNAAPEAARLSSLLHLTCLLFEVSVLRVHLFIKV